MIIIFIGFFSFLIRSKKLNFNNKQIILNIELIINLLITLIFLIICRFGITTIFIMIWFVISVFCYYVYNHNHEKYGFIGTSFCTFFFIIFLVLQLWIYGTTY